MGDVLPFVPRTRGRNWRLHASLEPQLAELRRNPAVQRNGVLFVDKWPADGWFVSLDWSAPYASSARQVTLFGPYEQEATAWEAARYIAAQLGLCPPGAPTGGEAA